MTLHDIASQIHNLTFGGHVNGEKFTKVELEHVFSKWLAHAEHNIIPNTMIIEVCLRDGRWLATISKTPYGYDYYIPDTREQESYLRNKLLGA